jgi:hypothetical protein
VDVAFATNGFEELASAGAIAQQLVGEASFAPFFELGQQSST